MAEIQDCAKCNNPYNKFALVPIETPDGRRRVCLGCSSELVAIENQHEVARIAAIAEWWRGKA